ncbi:MAG: hypothetical protein KC618_07250, partial [Candidatus Omnitrophica bacterium]|nr:hypothetical protein [Candidatus Omnitrophota bacterium]
NSGALNTGTVFDIDATALTSGTLFDVSMANTVSTGTNFFTFRGDALDTATNVDIIEMSMVPSQNVDVTLVRLERGTNDAQIVYDEGTDTWMLDQGTGAGLTAISTAASAGDVTAVGDCSTGECFTAGGSGTDLFGTTGAFTLGAVGGSNDESLEFDFETTADTVTIDSTTGVSYVIFNTSLRVSSGPVLLENTDYIDNSTDGTITLGGADGTNNENLTFDFETTANLVTVDSGTSAKLEINIPLVIGDDSDTVADSGDGNPATATLTPTQSYAKLTCSDADGCDITMGETGMVDGTLVTIVNVSANVCNFSDSSGVSELNGDFAMNQYETLELIYVTDRWVERSRSAN